MGSDTGGDAAMRIASRDELVAARRRKANLAGADLGGADLAGLRLAGIAMPGANLQGANLAGAALAGSDLSGADLGNARMTGIRIAGVNLNSGPPLRAVNRCPSRVNSTVSTVPSGSGAPGPYRLMWPMDASRKMPV